MNLGREIFYFLQSKPDYDEPKVITGYRKIVCERCGNWFYPAVNYSHVLTCVYCGRKYIVFAGVKER